MMTLNVVILILSICIVIPYDTLLIIVVANMPMVSSVIQLHLDDLSDALLQRPHYSNCERKHGFLNIVLMHKQYDE